MSAGFQVINKRQRMYLEGLAKGMSRTEAVRYAQYAESTRPWNVERSSSVKAAFSKLIRRTAPAHKLAKLIEEGLDATRTVVVGEGEPLELPDYKERREYAMLAAKWGEYTDSEKSENQVNLGLTIINGVTAAKREVNADR